MRIVVEPYIELVAVEPPYGGSGGVRAAWRYVFLVDRKSVAVEVNLSAMRTQDGQMDPETVNTAAKAFLELQAERFGWSNLPDCVVLTEAAMDAVVNRLGWNPRFGRKVQE